MSAHVITTQVVDPRIEPQPDPVYLDVIAPRQNQYYMIPASGKSDSSLTFNNLTTLGIDRAYLDTFELELCYRFDFYLKSNYFLEGATADAQKADLKKKLLADFPFNSMTFDSFPFNKCCEECRININGGSFFSQPLTTVRAVERYWNEEKMAEAYGNICPIHKPQQMYEHGSDYSKKLSFEEITGMIKGQYDTRSRLRYLKPSDELPPDPDDEDPDPPAPEDKNMPVVNRIANLGPTYSRYPLAQHGMHLSPATTKGGFNNQILNLPIHQLGESQNRLVINDEDLTIVSSSPRRQTAKASLYVTWREPILCAPFSSRFDATYGRPLYNITSLDLNFQMQDLGNMIRVTHCGGIFPDPENNADEYYTSSFIDKYEGHIESANLCYQVMTVPPEFRKPSTTLVPYRRFVPYITDITGDRAVEGEYYEGIRSGVYTFNEVPEAIWIFVAPSKAVLQHNYENRDVLAAAGEEYSDQLNRGNWDCNKLFGIIRKINLSLANTTQILYTALPVDLYRIAKANGCQDSAYAWMGNPNNIELNVRGNPMHYGYQVFYEPYPYKHSPLVGSVLRLEVGRDIIIPDQHLIPASNANNMVFQAVVNAVIPPHTLAEQKWSLYLLFEYNGVAALSPGQCEVTMNPIGNGDIMKASPVVSATSASTDGAVPLTGAGFWDKFKRGLEIANQIGKDSGIISKILRGVGAFTGKKEFDEWADKVAEKGYGELPRKRGRGCVGGAVMGLGDFT